MIDLSREPIVHLPGDKERAEREVMDDIHAQGRVARRFGFPHDSCPPYAVSDWCIYWSEGWRWEDEDIRRKRSEAQQ